MEVLRSKKFTNGIVYCLKLADGMLVETTDTFLPFYTKDAIGRKQNKLDNTDLGNRSERWMIGVSTMSGCPVRCKFCATGNMKRFAFNKLNTAGTAEIQTCGDMAGGYSGQPTKPRNL